jgi:acetolactate synthase-1/2/3 large subunit
LDGIGGRDVSKGNAYRAEVESVRQQIYDDLKEQWGSELRTFEAIRAATPRDTIFALDPTVATSRASRCLPIYGPRTFMYPHGWVGIGFAFPAALGAKLGRPECPVVCVTGDGGFQYNLQELATAAQYGIHPIVLMFNDSAWGVLKGFQKDRFDGRLLATELVNPDFIKLFESYGFEGTRVTSVSELSRALETALASGRTYLLEVQIPNGFGALT